LNTRREQDLELLRLIELAAEVPVDQREEALQRACDDADLIRTVLGLVNETPDDSGFLTQPLDVIQAVDLSEILRSAGAGEPEFDVWGIGPVRLQRKLGQGGMGQVYLAEQTRPIERTVAIKVMYRNLVDAGEQARFIREQQVMARMSHPNIGQIFDAGTTDEGYPYFVMEYIDGMPITSYCDSRRLGLAARLKLLVDVCMAVRHAHQRRFLHLDIKPSNILVTEVEGQPLAKLIDFGISVNLDHHSVSDPAQQTSSMLGTPAYASPEMINPELEPEDLDTRADIYSLGVLLCELLCGALPREIRGRSAGTIYRDMVASRAVPPSHQLEAMSRDAASAVAGARSTTPKALIDRLQGDLDAIVARSLDTDRDRRYATANELAADIGHFLAHRPVKARPWTRRYLLSRFLRRNRLAVAATAAVFAVLLLAIVGISLSLREATRSARESAAIAAFLQDMLEVNDFHLAAGASSEWHADLRAQDMIGLAAEQAIAELSDQPAVQASVLQIIGNALRLYPDPWRPVPLLEKAVALRRQLYGPDHPDTVTSQLALARAYRRLGRYADTEATLAEALPGAESALGPKAKLTLEIRIELAKVRFTQYRTAATTRELEDVLDAAIAANLSFYNIGDVLSSLGWDAYNHQDFARAVDYHSRALALYEQHLPPVHASVALMKNNLAVASLAADHIAEAEALAGSAVEIFERTLGRDHWRTANARANLGAVRMHQGRYPEAEALMTEALPRVIEGTGPKTVYSQAIQRNLEELYERWGQPGRAAEIAGTLNPEP